MTGWAVALLTLATSTTAVDGSAATKADAELLAIELNIMQKTNDRRMQHGLPPLQMDLNLVQSARQHAAWMARNRVMRHTNANVAENIAAGQTSSTEAVSDWMQSPGHRANILNSNYRRIGAAAYRGPDGQVYWCQQFLW